MKKLSLLVLLIFFSLSSFSQDGSLRFPELGYSIQPLEPNLKDVTGNYIALNMFLPSSEEFAPNINIIVQDYPGSAKDYKELSDGQFESLGVKMMRSDLKDGVVFFEYTTDKFGGTELHIYTRAYFANSKVYMATATATIKQWKKYGKQLVISVDSIKKI